jgi:coproporphyrinogen III oxidase-like Fe-S oxidoreductase
MLNATRLREGFDLQDFQDRTGLPISSIDVGLKAAAAKGMLLREGSRVVPTERGFDFLSDLQTLFLPVD